MPGGCIKCDVAEDVCIMVWLFVYTIKTMRYIFYFQCVIILDGQHYFNFSFCRGFDAEAAGRYKRLVANCFMVFFL